MVVTTIAPLRAGTKVSIARKRNIVKIAFGEEVSFFDVSSSEAQVYERPTDAREFTEFVSISDECPTLVILTRFDLDADEAPDREGRELIRQGAHYTVNLGQADEDDPNSRELRAVLFYVLRDSPEQTSLLGLIDLAPERVLSKDENVVAVLDLLGFSNIIRTYSLDELEQKFTQGLLGLLRFLESLSSGALAFSEDDIAEMPGLASRISYGVVSDTIVLYPGQSTEQPLTSLCETVSILMDWALQMDWLLRGAIAVGSFRALGACQRL
jgi:hypothetical protein